MSGEIARLGSAFFLVRRPGADLRKPSAEVTSSEFHHGKNLRSPAGKSVSRSSARRLHGLPEKIRNSWRGLPRSLRKPQPRSPPLPAGAADHRPGHARARQPGCRFHHALPALSEGRRRGKARRRGPILTATSPRPGSSRPPMRWSRTTTRSRRAVQTALDWGRFTPATVNGKPVRVYLGGTVLFIHQNGEPVIVVSLATTIATEWANWPTTFSRNWLAACATRWRRQSVRSPRAFSSPARRRSW